MSSDNIEDEPTLFSKKPKASGNAFSVSAGRGTADTLASLESEKSHLPEDLTSNRENPTLNIADHSDQVAESSLRVFKSNYGVALATPIFNTLFKAINSPNINADQIHQQFATMLRRYETQLVSQGISEKRVRLMLYGIAATIDDIILQKDWAFDSRWSQESMISLFFKETWGGERFFTLLKEMMNSSSSFIKEMELYYLCIQFGFEGRYRLAARDTELNQMRDELFHIIRDAWGALPFELSPAWKGVTALNPQVRPFKNLWYWGLLLTLLLGALYLILSNFLHRKTEIAVQDVNNIMTAPAIVAEQAGVSPESPASAVIPQKPDVDVIKDLSNWQNSGQIKITKDNNKFIIATTKELFASASTNLRDPYPQLIEDVAKVLNKLPGKIEVIGHTDNVPIHTAKYADNMALSVARAQAVANLIANSLSTPSRISSKGMGATDPTEPNTTAEGRLANRRVDIILTTP